MGMSKMDKGLQPPRIYILVRDNRPQTNKQTIKQIIITVIVSDKDTRKLNRDYNRE